MPELNAVQLVVGFLAGVALGGVYHALLWVAVRQLAGARGPMIFIGLALLRAALVIGALAVAFGSGLPLGAVATAMLGFLTVRLTATRAVRPTTGGT